MEYQNCIVAEEQCGAVFPHHMGVWEWVNAIGFSNIIWVLFMARFLIPWEAMGFAKVEEGSPQRFMDPWQASTFVLGAVLPCPRDTMPLASANPHVHVLTRAPIDVRSIFDHIFRFEGEQLGSVCTLCRTSAFSRGRCDEQNAHRPCVRKESHEDSQDSGR